jgi:hypothetical protein
VTNLLGHAWVAETPLALTTANAEFWTWFNVEPTKRKRPEPTGRYDRQPELIGGGFCRMGIKMKPFKAGESWYEKKDTKCVGRIYNQSPGYPLNVEFETGRIDPLLRDYADQVR